MSTHIFEYIVGSDRFGYGRYTNTLEIIIDKKTHYINATKLCQLGSKHLRYWQRTDASKELLSYYDKPGANMHRVIGTSYEVKQEDIKGLSKKEQETIVGTYYHKDLIVHIAQWISPAFAFKISKIVDDYISRENDRIIVRLEGENDDLKNKNNSLEEQIKELLTTTKTIVTLNHEQNAKLDKMMSSIEKMRQHLDNNTSVPNKREAILIYRNQDDPIEVIRIRCGIASYIKQFKHKAIWYREYANISNSKKAINYMKDHNMIAFEKDKTTKVIIPDKSERLYIRRYLTRLDESYCAPNE